jgi:hypothetical protein
MDCPVIRSLSLEWILGGLLVFGVMCSSGEARAQEQPSAQGDKKAGAKGRNDRPREAAKSNPGGADRAPRGASEPSAAYQESMRRTVEKRRQRRARRQQNAGDSAGAVGAIVPWPMPPALIIRHTREVHGEVDSLVYGLRR